jgi:hypothetical protein
MAAIEGGTGEKLIESYELDVARANLMLQKILAGPEVLFASRWPTRPSRRRGRRASSTTWACTSTSSRTT